MKYLLLLSFILLLTYSCIPPQVSDEEKSPIVLEEFQYQDNNSQNKVEDLDTDTTITVKIISEDYDQKESQTVQYNQILNPCTEELYLSNWIDIYDLSLSEQKSLIVKTVDDIYNYIGINCANKREYESFEEDIAPVLKNWKEEKLKHNYNKISESLFLFNSICSETQNILGLENDINSNNILKNKMEEQRIRREREIDYNNHIINQGREYIKLFSDNKKYQLSNVFFNIIVVCRIKEENEIPSDSLSIYITNLMRNEIIEGKYGQIRISQLLEISNGSISDQIIEISDEGQIRSADSFETQKSFEGHVYRIIFHRFDIYPYYKPTTRGLLKGKKYIKNKNEIKSDILVLNTIVNGNTYSIAENQWYDEVIKYDNVKNWLKTQKSILENNDDGFLHEYNRITLLNNKELETDIDNYEKDNLNLRNNIGDLQIKIDNMVLKNFKVEDTINSLYDGRDTLLDSYKKINIKKSKMVSTMISMPFEKDIIKKMAVASFEKALNKVKMDNPIIYVKESKDFSDQPLPAQTETIVNHKIKRFRVLYIENKNNESNQEGVQLLLNVGYEIIGEQQRLIINSKKNEVIDLQSGLRWKIGNNNEPLSIGRNVDIESGYKLPTPEELIEFISLLKNGNINFKNKVSSELKWNFTNNVYIATSTAVNSEGLLKRLCINYSTEESEYRPQFTSAHILFVKQKQ